MTTVKGSFYPHQGRDSRAKNHCFRDKAQVKTGLPFFLILFVFNYMYLYVSVCEYAHVDAGTQGGKKKASDPLELKLQAVVSHLMWVLGTAPGSSATAV